MNLLVVGKSNTVQRPAHIRISCQGKVASRRASAQGERHLLDDLLVAIFNAFGVGKAPWHQITPSSLTGHNNAAASWLGLMVQGVSVA